MTAMIDQLFARIKFVWLAAIGLLALCPVARAQLVVDADLGSIGPGSHQIVGDTAGGPNNAQNYFAVNDGQYWGSERVYSFTTTQLLNYALTVNSTSPVHPTTNLDYHVLDSLATELGGASNSVYASSPLFVDTLDDVAPQVGGTQFLLPGTYYLAVDSFAGESSTAAGATGQFDITVDLTAAATNLGALQANSSLNTFYPSPPGDNVDTQIAIFDGAGNLLAENDQSSGTDQSQLFVPNDVGNYYLAMGAFETIFGDGWFAESSSADNIFTNPVGDVQLNYVDSNGAAQTDGPFFMDVNEVFWYEFAVDNTGMVPPPAVDVDLGAIALANTPVTLTVVAPGTDESFDSELGLYDSEGVLIAENDDALPGGAERRSLIDVPDGLDVGTYYLALGEYNTTFDALFNVSSIGGGTYDWELLANDVSATGALSDGGEIVWFELAIVEPPIGDFNRDGVVDAADYPVWRDSEGLTGPGLVADANNDQIVDAADYALWRENFGSSIASLASTADAVPEPGAITVLLLTCAVMLSRNRSVKQPCGAPRNPRHVAQ